MNQSSFLCATVKYLADSTELKTLLIARCVITITSIILFLILFKVQGTYLSFHSNARWLLICHHIWAISMSAANFIAHVFDLVRLDASHDNPCDYLLPTSKAIAVRGATVVTLYGQVFACATMVVERISATIHYRTYETASNELGKFLILIQCLLSSILFFLTIENLDWSEMKAYSSVTSSRTSARFSDILTILAVIELISLATFIGLLVFNKYKKKHMIEASLSGKYQVDENIRAIRLMIPIVLTHFCIFMPTVTIFPIYMTFVNPNLVDPKAFAIFLEMFNFAPIYPFILPIVLFWRHKVLRDNLRKAIRMRKSTAVTPIIGRANGRTDEQIRHFQVLKEMWALPK